MNVQEEFDLITLIYCDYGALSQENRILLLNNAYRALKKGGSMVFNVFSTEKYNRAEHKMTWEYYEKDGFWNENKHIVLNNSNVKYANHVFSDQYYVITDRDIKNYYLWNTCYTKEKLTDEIRQAGFMNPEFYSDITGKIFSDHSDTLAVILSK